MTEGVFVSRMLNCQSSGGLTALDAVRWATPVGTGFRVFFKYGTPGQVFDLSNAAGSGDRISGITPVNGGLLLHGSGTSAEGLIELPLLTGSFIADPVTPEPELFDGLRVAIAVRSGESADIVETWLLYHVLHHGLNAAIILDRAEPGSDPGFGQALAGLKIDGLTRLMHLTSSEPLGQPGLPPERHAYNAPDAPGRERMDVPPPDPWSAPLGEALVYEIARWRFLGRARAVTNIDICDFLAPGTRIFEVVHDTLGGVLELRGQRAYPWRVRKGAVPGYGDHICTRLDGEVGHRRWCLAPARLGPDHIWRFVRVTNVEMSGKDSARFYRAMAVRHPGASSAEIVPKSSLVENPVLLELAQTVFGQNPVRPPVSKLTGAAPKTEAVDAGPTCIITTMKNEGPFILEWLAYHRAIGVKDFLIYSNDCTDGTDTLLDLLAARGLVEHRDNPFKGTGLKPQHAALQAAEAEAVVIRAGWVICMDVDEFINIHVGRGRLRDLYDRVGDANMISLTWRLFGSSDIHAFKDGFITEAFSRCAPEFIRKPHQAWGFKTLFRNIGIYKKLGVHRPKGLKPDLWDQIRWVNGSGQPMPKTLLRNGWRSTPTSYGYGLVTLNHYAARCAESFLVKRDRGRVNHVERDQGLAYWFRMNNNAEEDRSIAGKLPMMRAEFDRLMADPEIAAAHAHSVTAHKARIAALMARPDYAELYAALTSQRLERLARLHLHFGANVFLAGPEVVPVEITDRDELPEDFFFTVGAVKDAAH